LIVWVPVPAVGVYVSWQVEVVVLDPCCAKVQVPLLLNDPVLPPGPLRLKLTVPCGNEVVPESLSTTVAVHVVAWFNATDVGKHETDVVVERVVTVTGDPVPSLLPACTESFGV
jgi:hypothetical protein